MTYKTYKIKNKFTNGHQNYTRFELDGYVEFSDKKEKFIYCVNEYQFTSYWVGDKIEVDLTKAKFMRSDNYHQEIIRKTSKSFAEGYYDDYIPQSDRDPRKSLTQDSITLSAYETEAVYDFLYGALEWLELYIEKANYYPNWQQKKQLPKTITRPDIPYLGAKETKEHFLTSLSGLKAISTGKPSFLLEKLQTEFFSWLDGSGIGVNSCHDELTQSLIDFHSILVGKAGEFTKRRRKEIDGNIAKMTSEEKQKNFYEIVAAYQEPLENEDKVFETMKGKTYKDVNNESKFDGNADQGKEIFKKIEKGIEGQKAQQDYREWEQEQGEMEGIENNSSSSTGSSNQPIRQEVVNDIRQNFKGWEVSVLDGRNWEKEIWFVRKPFEIGWKRNNQPIFDSENMYKAKELTAAERVELGIQQNRSEKGINKVVNSSQPQKNNISTSIIITIASIGALLIASAVIAKKRLNKKLKR